MFVAKKTAREKNRFSAPGSSDIVVKAAVSTFTRLKGLFQWSVTAMPIRQ